MVRVRDYCVDRYEVSLVDRDSGRPLSPYYPPHRGLLQRIHEVWSVERQVAGSARARAMPLPDVAPWQRREKFQPMAVSRPGVVPQGYLSQLLARRACKAAGKRLCTEEEWTTACRGAAQTRHPYGDRFIPGRCNVFRALHPASILHGSAAHGHTDPRLNLVFEFGRGPLLQATGTASRCASGWGPDRIYDMVGNLDEWIADDKGVFLGGFYARSTSKGCEAKIASHSPVYYDYSTGTRCCSSLRSVEQRQ